LKVKQGIQVSLSLVIALWIFYVLNKDLSWAELNSALKNISYPWMLASIAIAVFGYWLRAWRWTLLLNTTEENTTKVKSSTAFFALLFGYLINLLVPRAGEIARCGFLNKTNQIPVGHAIGTVILERIIDLLFFVLLIILGFILENQMLLQLTSELISIDTLEGKLLNYLPIMLIIAILFIWILRLMKNRLQHNKFWLKIKAFLDSLKNGLKSVLELQHQFAFWSASIGIWLIYYLTLVFVAWSFPVTDSLSYGSVLVVMVMGSIGMIAPVQGGIGTFHALVAYILTIYGLSEQEGKIFAIIVHGSQMITLIGLGLVSLVVLFKITSSLKQKTV
jgi:glycosyltransferase 2 family protein